MAMRALTEDELDLFFKAHKVLGTPIKSGTNITALSLILDGKTEELEQLIKERENEDKPIT